MNTRFLILLLTGFSAASILGAWGFQYIGDMAPCKLCYTQRYPHWAAMLVGVVILLTGWRVMAWLGGLAALATSLVGFYHSGVERKLWQGPTSCTSSGVEGLSADDLMAQIMAAPLARCDEIPWQMLGVTMANLNAVGSLAAALLWLYAARMKD